MDDKSRQMYFAWLLNSVMIHGRTTYWCALQTKDDPAKVLEDLDRAIEELESQKR